MNADEACFIILVMMFYLLYFRFYLFEVCLFNSDFGEKKINEQFSSSKAKDTKKKHLQ